MAIQINLSTSQFGIPFTGAYFRIATASISRLASAALRHTVAIDVVGYATQPQNEDCKEVDFRRYHAPLSVIEAQVGDDFLSKCYAWVMTQNDMLGSIAV